jgi:signal transduction histidine kinase
MTWLGSLLDAGRDLAPHGYCLLWQPELVWTHVVADALIAAAYFSIPIAIVRFVRARQDVEFSWIFWLFALFILACGTTHLMSIWILWNADYGWQALIKVITAVASVGTAIVLWPLIPKALALPSPLMLRQKNEELEQALGRLQHEMTERKRAEEALRQAQKMEAVGQLTGGIAHDFNNLLQSVSGMFALIVRQPDSPKVVKWAGVGLEAAERGAKLTGQLLAFSRIQKLELRPNRVEPLLTGMKELIESTIGPGVTLELDVPDGDRSFPVLCDRTQVELAVMNLAINARDAMPGGGRVTISARSVDVSGDPDLPDGVYKKISVGDTGTGMPAEIAARAFEPFFTTKNVGQGTGLGLSMVYGVARQSGGRAEIESTPGAGTIVSILLPRVADAAGVEEGSVDETKAEVDPKLILVVDDDDNVRTTTASMLESLGHSILEADGGPAALALLEASRPDLILMDYAMPGMNGAEAARLVPDTKGAAPILFVTGYADTEALIQAVGPDAAVLRKPFLIHDLARALKERLG